jgi:hypothetical protein
VTPDLTGIPPVHLARRAGRRPRIKQPETRAARRERLHRAAGEAIARAAETDGDPVALMAAAAGVEAKYCDYVIRQHSLFAELRAGFLMPEQRLRKEREERIAAIVAAEPGLVVWVRREFKSLSRRAAYRMTDVTGLHWSRRSGGKKRRANRPYLHAYVWCDAMIVGAVAHSGRHGPPPHRIKVCIVKVDNKKIWREIERAAPEHVDPGPCWSRRSRFSRARKKPSLDRVKGDGLRFARPILGHAPEARPCPHSPARS